MISHIEKKGHCVLSLPEPNIDLGASITDKKVRYSSWLGVDTAEDARQTLAAVESIRRGKEINLLILDHYSLDETWEGLVGNNFRKVMVIDDLANRKHKCDFLLDQTFGRNESDYYQYVRNDCSLLIGPKYAILRSEFYFIREYSLNRRRTPNLEHILITMGGVDKDNATGKVLESLHDFPILPNCHITVVMGGNAPWLNTVKELAQKAHYPVEVKTDVDYIAKLMAECDLCIGATGSTSWERCCLGVPTISIELAENQKFASRSLEKARAIIRLKEINSITSRLPKIIRELKAKPEKLAELSKRSRNIVDGRGGSRVISEILK